MTSEEVRRIALGFAETTEQDHWGFPSYRTGGRIFATLPDAATLHVMVDEEEIAAAVAEDPSAVEELRWGKRLRGLRVKLAQANPVLVAELLEDAWNRKAPKRLLHADRIRTANGQSSRNYRAEGQAGESTDAHTPNRTKARAPLRRQRS